MAQGGGSALMTGLVLAGTMRSSPARAAHGERQGAKFLTFENAESRKIS